MTIHVVQPGENIQYIADLYKVSASRLIMENDLRDSNNLAVGQTIVVVKPRITYTVEEGDRLHDIAIKNQVPLTQILQNNPYLLERDYIYPGETLVLQYDTDKSSLMVTNGYSYPFINRNILRKTLPFLTYLTVFHYQQLANGELVDIDDEELIQLAKDYGVAPMMLVSTQSSQGNGNRQVARALLASPEIEDCLIENIMGILKRKGYHGLNQYFQFYTDENQASYLRYLRKLSQRVREEGFELFITISPREYRGEEGVYYEDLDYSQLTQYVDQLIFLTYNWGFSYSPPACTTPVNLLQKELSRMVTATPSSKVSLGLPVIGYDWQLPYIPGYTRGNAMTFDRAVWSAVENDVAIMYNDIAQAPYFYYYDSEHVLHNVWFKDARSVDVISALVPEYELRGLTIWNVMYFFAQMWLVLNNKFEIVKITNLLERTID